MKQPVRRNAYVKVKMKQCITSLERRQFQTPNIILLKGLVTNAHEELAVFRRSKLAAHDLTTLFVRDAPPSSMEERKTRRGVRVLASYLKAW